MDFVTKPTKRNYVEEKKKQIAAVQRSIQRFDTSFTMHRCMAIIASTQ